MNRQGKILSGVVAMAVAVGAVLSAQAPVTITLRSGETLQASLVDMGGRGFEVRVGGSERFIAKDLVAMVDFGGNVTPQQAWFNGMSPANNLVVFKNGDTLLADWTDVGGTSPLILRFNSGAAEREISADQVARIYLVPASVGLVMRPKPVPEQSEGGVNVMASEPWTSAGITVSTGEYLRFSVSREIKFGTEPNDTASADGNSAARVSAVFRSLPVRSLPVGGLIGKVGNGQPFSIGSAPQPIRMPANGQLFLGINDLTFTDNSGWFRVVITRGR
ncbi:MAG: hypothetical protein EXQ49_04865 [Acidobacteria bacterium]|nr:hypothetical protein [Acidobacteriota bacterium]